MGIIQPKMLFSRIRISHASGLHSCLDSHSWLRAVSLDLYLLCHRLFATPTKAVGANQARSWDENSVNGISKISIFGLRLLSWWFCQDCAGMCLTQAASQISRRAAGKSLSTLKKTRGISKVRLPHNRPAVTSKRMIIPQVAIAIGVLTSNRGRATNHFGGLDVAPVCHCRVQRTWCPCCAIVGCHCSVLWLGATNFGGVDVVPLLGAIAALSLRGEGDDQIWGVDVVPLQGAIVVRYGGGREGDGQLWRSKWCHCRVPL